MEHKTCKQCQKQFEIPDDDLEFYQKISPTFDGKKFSIPSPRLCPDCRQIKRLCFRNERSLYRRKCDKTGEDIVSMFSPDKKDVVYSVKAWWEDDWDELSYGVDYDQSRPFFAQVAELFEKVPKSASFNMHNENCEFSNYIFESKNCYMSVVCYYGSENVHFSYVTFSCKDCVDCHYLEKCEKCYKLLSSNNCYNCDYSIRLNDCRDCKFSVDLTACSDCLFCSNLSHKQYWACRQINL